MTRLSGAQKALLFMRPCSAYYYAGVTTLVPTLTCHLKKIMVNHVTNRVSLKKYVTGFG